MEKEMPSRNSLRRIDQLKDEKLYMEVYQRRENLLFFGTEKKKRARLVEKKTPKRDSVDFPEDK